MNKKDANKMNKKVRIKFLIHLLLLMCFAGAKEMPHHNTLILEYLFSHSAEQKYHEMIKLRALHYDRAEHMLKIEDIFQSFSHLDLKTYTAKLKLHQIDIEKGKAAFMQSLDYSLDIHQWAYVQWLLAHNEDEALNGMMKHLSSSDQIWTPVLIDSTENNFQIDYYLSTQFFLSRYFIELYIKNNIGHIDPEWDGDKLYLWLALLPSVREYFTIDLASDDLDYTDRFIINSIYYLQSKNNELNDYENTVHGYNPGLHKLDPFIDSLDSLYNDIDMQNEIWDDCECMEEYGLFMMKVVLGRVINDNDKLPLSDLDKIIVLENSFEYFQNIANIITYKYDEIDHDLFCLYFASNFNNQEKQLPFIIEYLDDIGIEREHRFSLLISSVLREIMAYTFSPTGFKATDTTGGKTLE